MYAQAAQIAASYFANRKARKYAEENKRYQEEQNRLAYERSLPWNSKTAFGSVSFDPETKEMLQTLSPEYQKLMNNFLGSSDMANAELQSMMTDPYAMEQEQFDRIEQFNANAYNQSRLQGQEAAIAQGRTGTQGYYDQMAIEDSINQNRLGGQMAAIGTGMDYRNMLKAEALGFGEGAMNVPGMLNTQADLGRMVGQGSTVNANMQGVRDAGNNYSDARSANAANMYKQFQDFDLSGLFATNSSRAEQRRQNPRTYSSLFNTGRIGNNPFGGDY
tara:strand:+ start:19 stop:843 length:825 start_codon:yes stop_codon:yes gene_type:complete